MALSAGTSIGPYEIVSSLGEGGMGEVYRATDTRLRRQVAIKVLPSGFAQDPERVARFHREAQVLAALNHPNIAVIYGLEQAAGDLALAMELVEGEDLADRLTRRGQMPVDEAIALAAQIATGLEAAHERGVVHRDLKPANIKIAPDGTAKILDFGLARVGDEADTTSAASADPARSPTMTQHRTEAGLILGTAAYMSPEQARGTIVDRRTDIWAFGVVLYEMLTGRRLFEGTTFSDVLAAVLRQDVDVGGLPAETPAPVRTLISRCLERDPRQRLRDIGEARVLLTGPVEPSRVSAEPPPRRRGVARELVPWVLAAVASIALVVTVMQRAPSTAADPRPIRATIFGPTPPQGSWFSIDPHDAPVVSPDGGMLVLPLEAPSGKTLFLRPLNSLEMTMVEGAGRRAFFSPDGASIAFVRPGSVWKMRLGERQPSLVGQLNEVIWDVGFAGWHPDGRLLVPGVTGLWSLPASGGDATLLLSADPSKGERFYAVRVIPDGRLLLHVAVGDSIRLDVLSSTATERRVVASGFERGWVVDDILVARQGGQWRASRLDLGRAELTGPWVGIADVPETDNPLGRSLASVDDASLVRELVWVSRRGDATPVGLAPAYVRWPRVSPDGRRIVLGVFPTDGLRSNLRNDVRITAFDLRTRGRTALDGYSEPVWSHDGRTVITSSGAPPRGGLSVQIADGSRKMEPLFTLPRDEAWPTDVSRDGRVTVFYGASREGASGAVDHADIFLMDKETGQRRRLQVPGEQRGARLSPDGRWLAFQSRLGDRTQIHVRPYPALDADYMVSPDGGDEPTWSPDGKELYFRRGADLLAVRVPVPGTSVGWPAPEVLFTGTFVRDTFGDQSYDVAPDGRFLMMRPAASGPVQVQVVLDWLADLRARLAAAR